MMPLHSRSCPMTAIKAVMSDRHAGIKVTGAMRRFSLTKKDLEELPRDWRNRYRVADVRAIARNKRTCVEQLEGGEAGSDATR